MNLRPQSKHSLPPLQDFHLLLSYQTYKKKKPFFSCSLFVIFLFGLVSLFLYFCVFMSFVVAFIVVVVFCTFGVCFLSFLSGVGLSVRLFVCLFVCCRSLFLFIFIIIIPFFSFWLVWLYVCLSVFCFLFLCCCFLCFLSITWTVWSSIVKCLPFDALCF